MARIATCSRLVFLLLNLYTFATNAQEDEYPLVGLNRYSELGDTPYDLELYSEPREERYRYALQDIDQNDIGYISPEDEYEPDELDYENNKNSDIEMEQVYPEDYLSKNRNKTFKKALMNFLDSNDINAPNVEVKKRVLSSFRERTENEKYKNQREKIAEQFLKKLENSAQERDADMKYETNYEYLDALKDLWKSYKNSHSYPSEEYEPHFFKPDTMKKRQMPEYSSLGWSSVGYKKRESPATYAFANEGLYRLKDDSEVGKDRRPRRYEWVKPKQYDNEDDISRSYYNQDYMYAKRKRNAVTKRSSNFYNPAAISHHKRFVTKEQHHKKAVKKEHLLGTDPKIVKDLKNIFGTKEINKTEHLEKKSNKTSQKNENVKKSSLSTEHIKEKKANATGAHSHHEKDKKKNLQVAVVNNKAKKTDEYVNIKKKSLDWSNYFGYDRRKKSRNSNEVDDDWIMRHYNKAYATASKKSKDYPLKYFRNHDELKKDSDETDEEMTKRKISENTNEAKLNEMDSKLKNIEDLIIDEALKYTGAHEGATDSKEIQETKDKVISRLAAAYSLEKMRKALGEFKTSIANQRYTMKFNEDPDKASETEAGNHLKQKKGDDEKHEAKDKKFQEEKKEDRSGYELDSEEDEEPEQNNFISELSDSDMVDKRCEHLARNVAGFLTSDFFYPLCKEYQMCYLCSPSDSERALVDCDVTFLANMDVLCQGDPICQLAARPAIAYLKDSFEADFSEVTEKTACHDNSYNHDYYNQYSIRR